MKIKIPYQIACDACDSALCDAECVKANALCDTFDDSWPVKGDLYVTDQATSSKGWAHIVREKGGSYWGIINEQGEVQEQALISDYLLFKISKTFGPDATELWLLGAESGQIYEGTEAMIHLDCASGERCSVRGVEGLLCVDRPGHYAMFPDGGGRSVIWQAKDVIRVNDRMNGLIVVEVTK